MRKQENDARTILRIGIVAGIFCGALSIAAWSLGIEVKSPESESASRVPEDPRITVLGEMSERVPESSGAAVSRQHDGIMWTHNDQGRRARIFAVTHDGRLRSTVNVSGVRAEDWEDIARAPCPASLPAEGDCLYIADTGDNGESRESYAVLILPEPDPAQEDIEIEAPARLELRYPEGPADTEALAVTPQGDVLLVTKGLNGESVLYRVPAAIVAQAASGSGDRVHDAARVGVLPLDVSTRMRRITGAALSPDGRTLAVRSLTSVYLFDVAQPLTEPRLCDIGPRQPQGEGIDFLSTGDIILTSERVGGEAPILRVHCERP
jgi:hypothetical protein